VRYPTVEQRMHRGIGRAIDLQHRHIDVETVGPEEAGHQAQYGGSDSDRWWFRTTRGLLMRLSLGHAWGKTGATECGSRGRARRASPFFKWSRPGFAGPQAEPRQPQPRVVDVDAKTQAQQVDLQTFL